MRTDGLPPRQQQIALLVADGLLDKQIAGQLNLSTRQVRREIDAIVVTWQIDRSKSVRTLIARHVLAVDNAA